MRGKLVGHIPVCGWLCVIARVLKRCMTVVTKGWDNCSLRQVVEEVLVRVIHDDPVQSNWSVSREELNTWVDASFLAASVVLEKTW